MKIFEGIADAADTARRYFLKNEDELPEHIRTKLDPFMGTGTSPVDLAGAFTRAVYANPDSFDQVAKAIAAGIADRFDIDGFHGKLDGKAAGMRAALRRDSGEPGDWPAADQDPAVDQAFAPPPPPEEPPSAAGPDAAPAPVPAQ
jgi:hypothetical protein